MHTRFVAPKVGEPTQFHVILEARDAGKPALYAYRRAIIRRSSARPENREP